MRVKTIVSPKIAETIEILQELLADLQGQSSATTPRTAPAGQNSAPIDKEIRS